MSRINRNDDVREEVKKTRIPVSSSRAPLIVRGFDHENFVGRWVLDLDDRLAIFQDGGYEFVTKDMLKSAGEATVDSSKGSDTRMTKPAGRGLTLYLMRIPREFWEADQKAKAKEIDRIERAMTSPGKGTVDSEVDYGEVSMGSQRGQEKLNLQKISKS